ncbi:MAG: hypothetical protein ACKOFV_00450 [Candidatus Nanopelagicaceae bacterium]
MRQSSAFRQLNSFITFLSKRPELETILQLIKDGYNNREIAFELAYSISLIRQETMRIYAKVGVNGRNELKSLIKKS